MPQFIRTGQAIPEITLPALDGSPVSLTSFRGRKLLVFMWASW